MKKFKCYFSLLRMDHYIKNLLIFLPLFFSRNVLDVTKVLELLYMFIPMCLAASVVYIINDIFDVDKDRLHPIKCHRPIASRSISKSNAIMFAVFLTILMIVMLLENWLKGPRIQRTSELLLIGYIITNILYSQGLKNFPIIDVFLLATGYLIRVFYGAAIIGVPVSSWLYFTVLTGAIYIGMGKRRNELRVKDCSKTRQVLNKYSYEFLDKNMHICLGLTITFYALWAIQTEYNSMTWTVPLVIMILMKYSLVIEREESDGNPIEVLLHDKALLALSFLYIIILFTIIYIK